MESGDFLSPHKFDPEPFPDRKSYILQNIAARIKDFGKLHGISVDIPVILASLVLVAVTCATRIISTIVIFGEVNLVRIMVLYLGMYLVTEATAGICYVAGAVKFCRRDLPL